MLKDILIGIASDTGLSLEDEETKNMLRFRVNEVAQELHESTDLVGSLGEMILFYDPKEKQVALPYTVDELRGIVWYNGYEQITLNDMRPLYGTDMNVYIQSLNWRDKYTHPLARPLVNYSRLIFKIPKALNYDIQFKIIGRTEEAERIIELVTLFHGTTEVECESNWVDIEAITKELITTYNIQVYDAEDNLLAIIPNISNRCQYRIIQILADNTSTNALATGVQILYKKRFFPMVNDEDEFICGPQYDKTLQWKFLFEYWSKMQGQEFKAANAAGMLKMLVDQKERNHSQAHDKPMQVKKNWMLSMFRDSYRRYTR